jgi:chorismate mutase/prephenate dehydratase
LQVGYQGSAGAYSYLAAGQYFAARRHQLDCHGFRTFAELVRAVEERSMDYGMLPVENTTAGSINEAYDLMESAGVHAVGEAVFRVEHCLVVLEPIPVERIRRIASHPQALAQCSEFLATLTECTIESYADTAMAVTKVVHDRDPAQAAIASQEAARRHALQVIKRDIGNELDNYTRFLVIAAEPVPCREGVACKTSLVFATAHERGALARCIDVFAAHDLNLTKLESRPRRGKPFEYLFYLDFEGDAAQPAPRAALDELAGRTGFLKVLGSYEAHAEPLVRRAAGLSER